MWGVGLEFHRRRVKEKIPRYHYWKEMGVRIHHRQSQTVAQIAENYLRIRSAPLAVESQTGWGRILRRRAFEILLEFFVE